MSISNRIVWNPFVTNKAVQPFVCTAGFVTSLEVLLAVLLAVLLQMLAPRYIALTHLLTLFYKEGY